MPRSARKAASRALLALITLAFAACGTPPAKPPAVVIVHHPPEVTYDTYPPGRPPPHVSPFLKYELGLCRSSFGAVSQLGVQFPRSGQSTVMGTISSARVVLRLELQIWCLEGSGPDVLAHEETHRAISEHYYRLAEPVAHRLASALIGQSVPLPGRDPAEGVDDALRPLQARLLADYNREVEARCAFAQERFDAITDHGRDPIDNATAMARALADEAAHWATNPF